MGHPSVCGWSKKAVRARREYPTLRAMKPPRGWAPADADQTPSSVRMAWAMAWEWWRMRGSDSASIITRARASVPE
jgi:hypothetical protein